MPEVFTASVTGIGQIEASLRTRTKKAYFFLLRNIFITDGSALSATARAIFLTRLPFPESDLLLTTSSLFFEKNLEMKLIGVLSILECLI